MDERQKSVRDLVERMLAASELDPTGLARAAGLSASTLTRFLNSPVKHTLSARTLQKLSKASGVEVKLGGLHDDPRRTRILASFERLPDAGKTALDAHALLLVSATTGEVFRKPRKGAVPSPPKGPSTPRPIPGGRVPKNRASDNRTARHNGPDYHPPPRGRGGT
jgi:transcriptional regulator with XRE-family HTH domain